MTLEGVDGQTPQLRNIAQGAQSLGNVRRE
jgi:hypothetical protein